MEKRHAAVETEIELAEARVVALDEQLFAEAADHTRAVELGNERDAAQAEVDRLFAEWEGLEETLAE